MGGEEVLEGEEGELKGSLRGISMSPAGVALSHPSPLLNGYITLLKLVPKVYPCLGHFLMPG